MGGAAIADRFDLLRPAGRGGMGEVWEAIDRRDGLRVALKLLLSEMATDPSIRARFIKEAELLAALDHACIVGYVAHGDGSDGRPWLAMRWLTGEDLDARLRRGRLSIAESCALARRVTEGVSALHSRGFIHRDVKPANVFLVDGDPHRAVLLDVGIARATASVARLTRTNGVIGTVGYMAPEQARGEPSIDARADLFAIGCVLYECLAGEPPFAGNQPAAVLAKVLFDEPAPLLTVRPDVPAALARLVEATLAKEPAQRPADGAALIRLLDRPAAADTELAQTTILSTEELRVSTVLFLHVEPGAREAVIERAAIFGERAVCLLDGTVVAAMRAGGPATDRAVRAARCALSLQQLPGVSGVAIATGRAASRSGQLVGPVVESFATSPRVTTRVECRRQSWQ